MDSSGTPWRGPLRERRQAVKIEQGDNNTPSHRPVNQPVYHSYILARSPSTVYLPRLPALATSRYFLSLLFCLARQLQITISTSPNLQQQLSSSASSFQRIAIHHGGARAPRLSPSLFSPPAFTGEEERGQRAQSFRKRGG